MGGSKRCTLRQQSGKAWGVSCASCRSLTQTHNHGVSMPPLMFIDSVLSSVWSLFAALGEIPCSEAGQGEARHAETPPNAKPIVFHSWTIPVNITQPCWNQSSCFLWTGLSGLSTKMRNRLPTLSILSVFPIILIIESYFIWWGATVRAKMRQHPQVDDIQECHDKEKEKCKTGHTTWL